MTRKGVNYLKLRSLLPPGIGDMKDIGPDHLIPELCVSSGRSWRMGGLARAEILAGQRQSQPGLVLLTSVGAGHGFRQRCFGFEIPDGHFKFPQARRPDYEGSGVMARRAVASLSR